MSFLFGVSQCQCIPTSVLKSPKGSNSVNSKVDVFVGVWAARLHISTYAHPPPAYMQALWYAMALTNKNNLISPWCIPSLCHNSQSASAWPAVVDRRSSSPSRTSAACHLSRAFWRDRKKALRLLRGSVWAQTQREREGDTVFARTSRVEGL